MIHAALYIISGFIVLAAAWVGIWLALGVVIWVAGALIPPTMAVRRPSVDPNPNLTERAERGNHEAADAGHTAITRKRRKRSVS